MSKINALIIAYWTIFVLPLIGYLVVNFYWWLFDGNVLIGDKMYAALGTVVLSGTFGLFLAFEVWE